MATRSMKRLAEFTLHGFSATAKTVAEAKEKAKAGLEKFVAEARSPRLVSFRGETAMVYRIPEGFAYAFLRPRPGGDGLTDTGSVHSDWKTWSAVEQAVLAHLMDNLLDAHEVYEDKHVPPALADRGKRDDIVYKARWQRAARKAKAVGADDIHRWAGEHERDAEFAAPSPYAVHPDRVREAILGCEEITLHHNADQFDPVIGKSREIKGDPYRNGNTGLYTVVVEIGESNGRPVFRDVTVQIGPREYP